MFSNIGGKIKTLATVITVIGIIASIIVGFVLMAALEKKGIGLLVMAIGSLSSWIGSFLLYGFGEIIELLSDIKTELQYNNGTEMVTPKETVKNIGVKTDFARTVQNDSVKDDCNVELSYDETLWTCPNCNAQNKYSDTENSQCQKCGWTP